tara:strand:+ start:138217 stop:138696 length:480 start_codon:yes stop_codon:yes gene_type:complete
MIDENGYRPNVGIVVVNHDQQVLWAQRSQRDDAWQFPQGGVDGDETAEEAMFRELHEEIGLTANDVSILAVTDEWLRYKLPKKYIRFRSKPLCIGQKQKWFLLLLKSDDSAVNLNVCDKVEFKDWKWVDYWHPVKHVIQFKQKVYQQALKEFAPVIFGK